ncbi:amino-acid N-acetyltransferase [Nitrosomonas sp. HPC101]|uniref:amino-acid N-acetyltransferase n=1 Tax=Nitrosomonas sp. HPC101 TaxID=1658667 RepID=UPI00136CF4A8|nr:amino-acid N-acetyltransferase [Nitrosomonas sp. HPC101]MXS85840.1 amino-acid N-acetyltransferase [Nitrosomonas sp. HPC101]
MKSDIEFVTWFRSVTPHIHTSRGKIYVIAFGGEVVANGKFVELVQDCNLLASLGIRLVLVHGARPQIESRLQADQQETSYVQGMRVTDATALQYVKEAVGKVRVEIEALLSMGLPNSPMANAAIRVVSGNFVTARPIGVLEGVDLQYTGEVRRINATAILDQLEQDVVVLLSPLGYSPTGEIFNLTVENTAAEVAIALKADKLIFLVDTPGIQQQTESGNTLLHELTVKQGKTLLAAMDTMDTAPNQPNEDIRLYLPWALHACELGVERVHLISRHTDGALLLELFTHGGIGSMITRDPLQSIRQAEIQDIGAILQLIEPLENTGTLVRRGRELLEMEIERFTVIEHDNMIIACAALYPFPDDKACELACVTVHPAYRKAGIGRILIDHLEEQAREQGYHRIFVLTTRTAHWFVERGFSETTPDQLPQSKQHLYNYQRRSKVFVKSI